MSCHSAKKPRLGDTLCILYSSDHSICRRNQLKRTLLHEVNYRILLAPSLSTTNNRQANYYTYEQALIPYEMFVTGLVNEADVS